MGDAVKIIECPRDAWQGLPAVIPAAVKAEYLRALIDAGFEHIDAVSFVSPKAVPQMADSERVLELLKPPNHVEIIGIVANRIGAERAIATGKVKSLGFPYSISTEFLRRNQKQTQKEALYVLEDVAALATMASVNLVAYISMAFGNPYGEPWSRMEVLNAARQLAESGARAISLADTVGLASPDEIAQAMGAVIKENAGLDVGVHLHARREASEVLIRAAYEAGCRRFDAAFGGLGGCPFAQEALVGNLPTEILIPTLADCGADVHIPADLDRLAQHSAHLARSIPRSE